MQTCAHSNTQQVEGRRCHSEQETRQFVCPWRVPASSRPGFQSRLFWKPFTMTTVDFRRFLTPNCFQTFSTFHFELLDIWWWIVIITVVVGVIWTPCRWWHSTRLFSAWFGFGNKTSSYIRPRYNNFVLPLMSFSTKVGGVRGSPQLVIVQAKLCPPPPSSGSADYSSRFCQRCGRNHRWHRGAR